MITKDTKISEILDLDERLCEVLIRHGLFCQGCPGAIRETLEEAAYGHGVSLEELLAALNDRSEQ